MLMTLLLAARSKIVKYLHSMDVKILLRSFYGGKVCPAFMLRTEQAPSSALLHGSQMCSTGREEKLQGMQDVQKILKSNFAQMHPLSTGDIERAETGGERWCAQAGQPKKNVAENVRCAEAAQGGVAEPTQGRGVP